MSSLLGPLVDRPSFVALVLITGTTALSTDTYIAALPQIQTTLGTSAIVAQLTMTACIAGMAIGQLLFGPISDAHGRRNLIIASTVAFTGMSILCAVAPSGWLLVLERAVQGIACGAASGIGRAVVTDSSAGRLAAARFGSLAAVGLVAPVVGPVIGGGLLRFGDWRTVFWFLAVVGAAMIVAALFGLPETLPPDNRRPGGIRQMGLRARELFADPEFRNPVLVQCVTVCGFFTYIGGSSFVLQHDLGISQQAYALVFAVNALAMVISSVIYRLLVLRTGPYVLRRVAVVVQTISVSALFAVALATPGHRPPLATVWICLSGMTLGLGTYLPSNSSIVQILGRRYGGTASALGGGLPFLAGALMTPLTGLLGQQSVMAMSAAMFGFFAVAAVGSLLMRHAYARQRPMIEGNL
jgi:DHA1 family bicyclomycin/chloramphenicol resistance-like MFS transporter